MKILNKICLFAISLVLIGCTSFKGETRLRSISNDNINSFDGIINDNIKTKNNYIFVIHGMGNTKSNYNNEMVEWLTKNTEFKLENEAPFIPVSLVNKYEVSGEAFECENTKNNCVINHFGNLQKLKLIKTSNNIEQNIFIYNYFWNDDLWNIQKYYLENDIKELNRNNPKRASINKEIKIQIINYGLGDAAAYLGSLGDVIREGVSGALDIMLEDMVKSNHDFRSGNQITSLSAQDFFKNENTRNNSDIKISFLSYSLGSRILFDVLSSKYEQSVGKAGNLLPNVDNKIIQSFINQRTDIFFMAANQLPLLGLGQVNITKTGRSNLDKENLCNPFDLAQSKNCIANGNPNLLIVSLHDPDDLLGYDASSSIKRQVNGINYIDIFHRNTNQYLGLFANPAKAHDHEMDEETSLKLIFCGADIIANQEVSKRKIKPKICN